jgi:hypothetical protein
MSLSSAISELFKTRGNRFVYYSRTAVLQVVVN